MKSQIQLTTMKTTFTDIFVMIDLFKTLVKHIELVQVTSPKNNVCSGFSTVTFSGTSNKTNLSPQMPLHATSKVSPGSHAFVIKHSFDRVLFFSQSTDLHASVSQTLVQ